jgi:hypothetical protein
VFAVDRTANGHPAPDRCAILDPVDPTPEDTYCGLHWKTRGIVERAAGRPFAWVDDEIAASDREWVHDRHPAPAFLLRIDPRSGLTADDLDALEKWLAGPDVVAVEASVPARGLRPTRGLMSLPLQPVEFRFNV